MKNCIQVINFKTRDFHGSINISSVSRVVSIPELSVAPDSPDDVIGLMNYEDQVVPVIDLSMRMKISEPSQYSLYTPIIICNTANNKVIGLVVQEVNDISCISPELIQLVGKKTNPKYISGIIKNHEYLSLIINVDELDD